MPVHELEHWQRTFLEGGMQRLKRQVEPGDRELPRTCVRLGEVMRRLELAENLIEKKLRGGVEEAQAVTQQRSPPTRRRFSAHDDLPV